MPRATITSNTSKFDLKSLAPDGFVELKRLTYGATLERRDMVMLMKFGSTTKGSDPEASTELQNKKVTAFEWVNSIVTWNLTDENDLPLDWKKSNIFDVIDPAVAEEISQLITDMNNFEGELKN